MVCHCELGRRVRNIAPARCADGITKFDSHAVVLVGCLVVVTTAFKLTLVVV